MAVAAFQFTVTNEAGDILPGAQIEVNRESGGLASLFSNRAGTIPLGNPFITVDGHVRFYVAGGDYRIDVTSGTFSKQFRHVGIGTMQERDIEDFVPVTGGLFTGPIGIGAPATSKNLLHIIGDHIFDGGNNYGLTIESFEPGITLVDRSTASGQAQITCLTDGSILMRHDANNDGTIGHTANVTDVESLSIGSASIRCFVPLVVANSAPTIDLEDSNGVATHGRARMLLQGDTYAIQTRTTANVFVSSDYIITRGATGATQHSWTLGGVEALGIKSTTHIEPGADNTQNFGSASKRLKEIFAGNGTINTSDGREKRVRGDLTAQEIDAWERVHWQVFQWLDAIDEKGEDARLHAGLVAQDIEAAFQAEGLDATAYGLLCIDEITKAVEVERQVERQATVIEQQEREVVEVRDGIPVAIKITEDVEVKQFTNADVVDERGKPVMDVVRPAVKAVEAKRAVLDPKTGEILRPAQPAVRAQPAILQRRTHKVPVMETVTETAIEEQPDGIRYGIRSYECMAFEAAYQRSRVTALEARIAAVEASSSPPAA